MRSACWTRWLISGAAASVMFMCRGSASAGMTAPSAAASALLPKPAARATRRARTTPRSVPTAKPPRSLAMRPAVSPSRSVTPFCRIQLRIAAFRADRDQLALVGAELGAAPQPDPDTARSGRDRPDQIRASRPMVRSISALSSEIRAGRAFPRPSGPLFSSVRNPRRDAFVRPARTPPPVNRAEAVEPCPARSAVEAHEAGSAAAHAGCPRWRSSRRCAVIDDADLDAFLREKPREAAADDSTANHQRVDIGKDRMRARIVDVRHGCRRTRSAIATGFAGARDAKPPWGSRGRPDRPPAARPAPVRNSDPGTAPSPRAFAA